MNYNYYVYILSNKYKTVLYTGVTNNLYRRTLEHKMKIHHGFAEKYNTDILVYYELFYNIESAIKRAFLSMLLRKPPNFPAAGI